jgi:hypothetical protein
MLKKTLKWFVYLNLLFLLGCGTAPEAVSKAGKSPLQTAALSIDDFAYSFVYHRASNGTDCDWWQVDYSWVTSMLPTTLELESCVVGSGGTLGSCYAYETITCNAATGGCAAKPLGPANLVPLSQVRVTHGMSGYSFEFNSEQHLQDCGGTVPSRTRFRLRASASGQVTDWKTTDCSTYSYPPLSHFQCQ